MLQRMTKRNRHGFSLVELSVVVIIIGVLAAFGIPRMLKSVERSKASEAFKYLASVRAAWADWTSGDLASALFDLGAITDDGDKDDLKGEKGNDHLIGGANDELKS